MSLEDLSTSCIVGLVSRSNSRFGASVLACVQSIQYCTILLLPNRLLLPTTDNTAPTREKRGGRFFGLLLACLLPHTPTNPLTAHSAHLIVHSTHRSKQREWCQPPTVPCLVVVSSFFQTLPLTYLLYLYPHPSKLRIDPRLATHHFSYPPFSSSSSSSSHHHHHHLLASHQPHPSSPPRLVLTHLPITST